jgi:hypothetical protein
MGSVGDSSVDDLTIRLDKTFSMVPCLSINIVSWFAWNVYGGALGHMRTNRLDLFRLEEKYTGL